MTEIPTQPIHAAPITGGDLWDRVVMDAADQRCQCAGACGATHAKSAGRCPSVHGAYSKSGHHWIKLHVAARDVSVPVSRAAELPAGALQAWCPACHRGTQAQARKAAEKAVKESPPDGLFSL